jgi:hypothetical protein
MPVSVLLDAGDWLDEYRRANHELIAGDPEFGRWLDEEYVPIGGGWQY